MAEKQNTPEIRFEGFTDPWEQRKLGELCELNPTAVLPDSFEYVDLESVAGTDMISHRREEKLTAPSRAQRLASFGDIFYQTVRPYQKNNYFYELPDEDYVFSTGYAQLRPLCDGRFLFSSLQRDQFVSCVLEHCTGTSYPAINANDLAALFLAVPIDAEEQRLVGSILKPIDSLITLHQRKHDKLCTLKKSMLDKMFPKPGETEPEIRFEGFTDPWEQRKLGNCGTTYGGLSGKTKEDFGHGNARFVPYTNVFDNPLTDTNRLETVEIDSSQNKVAYGDTFFTVSSETPDEVGMSSVWLSDQDDVYLNSFCFGYRQDSTFDPHYLAYMLRSSSIRSDLTLLAQGISRFNISKNKVMELSVPVPSAAEQKQIGQYFARLDSLITLHQRKLELLRNIKKSLLDRMFV